MPNKKEISLDCRLIQGGGIGTYLKILLRGLSSSFSFRLLGYKEDLPFLKEHGDVTLMKSPLFSLHEQIELTQKISKTPLFWSPHVNVPLLPIRAKKRLTTIHDTFHLQKKGGGHLFYNAASALSDHLITISPFSFNEIVNRFFVLPKKLSLLPNGIDPLETKIPFGRVLPPKFLLWVGNGRKHKNLLTLLRAYLNLEIEEELVVVGKMHKKEMKEAFDLIRHSPKLQKRTHFFEDVEDFELPHFYKRATLLVFISLYEGFGCPPLEAFYFGCPVISSPFETTLGAALIVDPLNVEALAKTIYALSIDPKMRQELMLKGKERVKIYLADKMLAAHKDLLMRLL